jgi:hypothetical protein
LELEQASDETHSANIALRRPWVKIVEYTQMTVIEACDLVNTLRRWRHV